MLAKSKGYDVFVSDRNAIALEYRQQLERAGIRFEEGQHTKKKILDSHLIIKSPGIPDNADIVRLAREADVKVVDEIEFAYSYTKAKIIAISGTNGKTTTTLLTYHLLKLAGFKVGLAGNVGFSLAAQVVEDKYDYFVVEMSSFQLDGCYLCKPYISVLLNITPDHLDRYDYKLQNYVASKFRLVQNADRNDHFIYNADNELMSDWMASHDLSVNKAALSFDAKNGSYFDGAVMHFANGATIAQADTSLVGPHNAMNTMAAVQVALIVGADMQAIRDGLKTFKNAPHRLEYVETINDVRFINDSKATNVDAVKYALNSFTQPLIWIAGGVDKGNKYDLIMDEVNQKVKALVCLGKDNSKLREAFHNQIVNMLETDNIKDAVREAMNYAQAHDVVLLSPACASFDLFNNYEDRGEQFKKAVEELKEEFENKAIN